VQNLKAFSGFSWKNYFALFCGGVLSLRAADFVVHFSLMGHNHGV
jgi:hypothetical protein